MLVSTALLSLLLCVMQQTLTSLALTVTMFYRGFILSWLKVCENKHCGRLGCRNKRILCSKLADWRLSPVLRLVMRLDHRCRCCMRRLAIKLSLMSSKSVINLCAQNFFFFYFGYNDVSIAIACKKAALVGLYRLKARLD